MEKPPRLYPSASLITLYEASSVSHRAIQFVITNENIACRHYINALFRHADGKKVLEYMFRLVDTRNDSVSVVHEKFKNDKLFAKVFEGACSETHKHASA
jgi:hypothetical protein